MAPGWLIYGTTRLRQEAALEHFHRLNMVYVEPQDHKIWNAPLLQKSLFFYKCYKNATKYNYTPTQSARNACSAYIIQFFLVFFWFFYCVIDHLAVCRFLSLTNPNKCSSRHTSRLTGLRLNIPTTDCSYTNYRVLASHTSLDACIIHALSSLRRTHKIFVNL